jgi:hypothetical protein
MHCFGSTAVETHCAKKTLTEKSIIQTMHVFLDEGGSTFFRELIIRVQNCTLSQDRKLHIIRTIVARIPRT